jgi:hypothetical protein
MTKHFDPEVPHEVRNQIFSLLDEGRDHDLLESLFGTDSLRGNEISDIQGMPCSGYIPFQDGGYQLTALFQDGYSTGKYPTPQYRRFIDGRYDQARDSWAKENPDTTEMEAHYNYIDSYLEDSEPLGRLSVYVKGVTVHISLGLGYSDAPYYREKYDESIVNLEVDFDTFLSYTYEQFVQLLRAGMIKYFEEEK